MLCHHRKFLLSLLGGALFGPSAQGGDFFDAVGSGGELSRSTGLFDRFSQRPSWLGGVEFTTDADFLLSDDIDIQRYSANLEYERGNNLFGITYTYTRYTVEYSPTSLGFENDLSEDNNQVALNWTHRWNGSYTSDFSASTYEGFTDFRSIWTSEFFRQSFGFFPAFENPDPRGFSLSFGTTYTFPNQIDTLRLDFGFSQDRIAPGFEVNEFTGTLDSSNDILDTYSVALTGEFYLTNKITSQWFARVAFVTDREVRTQIRSNLAWSLHDRLTLRGEIGATFESPDFDAFFGGLSFNYQITPNLEASLGYRLYNDSGEITTSNFNTAAPGVDTSEAFISLLYSKGGHSFRASFAFLDTDFETVNVANIPFQNLFQDRDFVAVRAAYSYQF